MRLALRHFPPTIKIIQRYFVHDLHHLLLQLYPTTGDSDNKLLTKYSFLVQKQRGPECGQYRDKARPEADAGVENLVRVDAFSDEEDLD